MQEYRLKCNKTSEITNPPIRGDNMISYTKTVFKEIVRKDDEDTRKVIMDYATHYAKKNYENVEVVFLNQEIVEQIIDLGIEEYLRRNTKCE